MDASRRLSISFLVLPIFNQVRPVTSYRCNRLKCSTQRQVRPRESETGEVCNRDQDLTSVYDRSARCYSVLRSALFFSNMCQHTFQQLVAARGRMQQHDDCDASRETRRHAFPSMYSFFKHGFSDGYPFQLFASSHASIQSQYTSTGSSNGLMCVSN